MASSKGKSLTGQQFIIRVILGIDGNNIFSPAEMAVLQGLPADRQEFAFITCSTGGLGKPFDLTGPEQVLLSFS